MLAALIWMLVASSWWPPWPVAPGRELMSSARRLGWWAEIASYLPPRDAHEIAPKQYLWQIVYCSRRCLCLFWQYVSSFEYWVQPLRFRIFWGYSVASRTRKIARSEDMWLAALSKTSGQHLERRHEAGSYHPICSGRDKSPASTPALSSAQAANIKITPMYAISDLCDPRLF